MNSSTQHRVEQALLQAVRQRRQQRRRLRTALALSACGAVVLLALWLRPPPAPVSTPAPEPPPPSKRYHEIATNAGAYTAVTTTSPSTLLVVHTNDAAKPIDLSERELFALLPDASIRITGDHQVELILPR